jgi:hypothetical protein
VPQSNFFRCRRLRHLLCLTAQARVGRRHVCVTQGWPRTLNERIPGVRNTYPPECTLYSCTSEFQSKMLASLMKTGRTRDEGGRKAKQRKSLEVAPESLFTRFGYLIISMYSTAINRILTYSSQSSSSVTGGYDQSIYFYHLSIRRSQQSSSTSNSRRFSYKSSLQGETTRMFLCISSTNIAFEALW